MLTTKTTNLKNVKKLYLSAFPAYERLPYLLMKILTAKKGVLFTEYYDDNEFCGFTYTVETDYTLFLYFLAVDESKRNLGYGSKILQHVKQSYPNKTITLNIEPLDETADNYATRVRRLGFYKRNGFIESGYTVYEVGGGFTVLYTPINVLNGETFTFKPDEYLLVYKKLLGPFLNAKMEKITK